MEISTIDDSDGKPWCIEPFTTLESKVWGNWGLCCRSKPLKEHARNVSPLEHFNSDTMKRIRLDMLNHTKTDEIRSLCAKCIEHEANGVQSRRQQKRHIDPPRVEKDGSIQFYKFNTVEVKFFGNLCNLQCRMCGPLYSSSIAATQRKQGEWHGPVHHDTWRDYTAGDKIQFYSDMKQILLNTQLVKFTGGEPMMNAGILDFIEWMVLQKLSHGLSLKIITNGTKINQDLLNFSKHFRSFDVAVSVDGVFDVDEYQRVGTDFWEVDYNIDVLKRYANVHMTTTVTAINVSSLDELMMYARAKQVPITIESIALFPDYLQVKVLPREYRFDLYKKHTNYPVNVKKSLLDPEWPVDLWEKFRDKNPNITEIIPELGKYHDSRI